MAVSLADMEDEIEKSPNEPVRGGSKGKLETLPDGEYTFAIDSGEWKDTKAGPLVKFDLVVFSPGTPQDGMKVEHAYFLATNGGSEKNERQISQLKKDLITLGFDVPEWTKANGRPFAAQLDLALAVIAGVQFKGKKVTNKGDKGTFHNLYVNERAGDDGRPATFGPEEMKPPTAGFEA